MNKNMGEQIMKNKNLHNAKRNKNDEFYTSYSDIEKELQHYTEHFKNKLILCNCNDSKSNFNKYFTKHLDEIKIKDLITYDGDFRSEECIALLKEADIVVTNPPFSLFRKYIAQLIKYDKKFLIVGHQNAITYKEIFPLIRDNKMWMGYGFKGNAAHFITPYEDYATANDRKEGMVRVSGVTWFTNLSHKKQNEELILVKTYKDSESNYPGYDNYDAINVNKTKDIPKDYNVVMGVPITFLDKYNPNQFEILGCHEPCIDLEILKQSPLFKEYKSRQVISNNKLCQKTYHRLFIRRKQ